MRTLEVTELQGTFKAAIDMAVRGEAVLVSTPSRPPVVVLSEDEYQALARAQRNAAFRDKIERSIADIRAGNVIIKTMEELEAMEE